MPVEPPETRYAHNGAIHLAYQVVGEGPPDMVFVYAVSHVELVWDNARHARFLDRLVTFGRLVIYDRRGVGLSDPVPIPAQPAYEDECADLLTVLDDAGIERPVVLGFAEGAPTAISFASRHRERCRALILFNATARYATGPDFPLGLPTEDLDEVVRLIGSAWLGGESIDLLAPSLAGDDRFQAAFRRMSRAALRPGEVEPFFRALMRTDVTAELARIEAPTLVLHRAGDLIVGSSAGRFIADHVPGARFVEVPGDDHLFSAGDIDPVLDEIQEFVTGTRIAAHGERMLTTVLFTDIVGSTEAAARLGNRGWRELLDTHDAMVRRQLTRFGGTEVKTTGDGFLATFADPLAAIECAAAVAVAATALGMAVRAGIHLGLCEARGADVGGMAVHIAARVQTLAGPNEVLVSSTVREAVTGSAVTFSERGTHRLKGVPGEWCVYTVQR